MTDPRAEIFAAVRAKAPPGLFNDPGNILALDNLLDAFGVGRAGTIRAIGPDGLALIKKWEGCKLTAYPDPGTGGAPWTIGWGATGPGIGPGVVWTQEQADRRLESDLVRYAADVSKAIGDAPTTQHQFDALVSFHYNTGAIAKAALTKKHKAADFAGAQAEFGKWINAGGKPLKGLINRRAAEAAMYGRAS